MAEKILTSPIHFFLPVFNLFLFIALFFTMKKPIVVIFDLLGCNKPDGEKTQPLCVYMSLEP